MKAPAQGSAARPQQQQGRRQGQETEQDARAIAQAVSDPAPVIGPGFADESQHLDAQHGQNAGHRVQDQAAQEGEAQRRQQAQGFAGPGRRRPRFQPYHIAPTGQRVAVLRFHHYQPVQRGIAGEGQIAGGYAERQTGGGGLPALRAAGVHRPPLVGGKPDLGAVIHRQTRHFQGESPGITRQAIAARYAVGFGPLRPGGGE